MGRSIDIRFVVGVVATALVATSCATRGDVDDLAFEHRQIQQRQDELQARMDELTENITRLLQGIRADFKADLGTVVDQMNAVEAALRGTETRIDELRRYRPRPEPRLPAEGDSTNVAVVDEVGLYNMAISSYQQGQLSTAREAFAQYLRLFPTGLSAPDAQYWIGIIAYDERRYEDAIVELRRVPDLYADSGKAPLALRKIGDAYRAIGEPDRGRAIYQELIDRYPDSSEAEAARRELGS